MKLIDDNEIINRIDQVLNDKESLHYTEIYSDYLLLEGGNDQMAEKIVDALFHRDHRFIKDQNGYWCKRQDILERKFLTDLEYIAVDVETTGISPRNSRITEIAGVIISQGKVVDQFVSLVNPCCEIPSFIERLTGITQLMVQKAPRAEEVMPRFIDFMGDRAMVAHNVHFDFGFIKEEIRRYSGQVITNERFCTVKLARRLMRGQKRRNLDDLCHALNINISGRHRALGDARACAQVFIRLLQIAEELGLETIEQLKEFQNSDRFERS